jgi:hypothetical protein
MEYFGKWRRMTNCVLVEFWSDFSELLQKLLVDFKEFCDIGENGVDILL